MVTRIVKLGIEEKYRDSFLQFTRNYNEKILSFTGCRTLRIFNDVSSPEIFFSISDWESEDDLNNYRHSQFFAENWKQIKVWFSQKAEVWTVEADINHQ